MNKEKFSRLPRPARGVYEFTTEDRESFEVAVVGDGRGTITENSKAGATESLNSPTMIFENFHLAVGDTAAFKLPNNRGVLRTGIVREIAQVARRYPDPRKQEQFEAYFTKEESQGNFLKRPNDDETMKKVKKLFD
jgi:hypothetical protein